MKKKNFTFWKYYHTYRSNDDGKLYWFFIVRLAPFLSYLFYNLGITANQVDMLSICVSLISAILFSFGIYEYTVVAAFLFLFWSILDACDGSIARATNSFTMNGAFLASMGHYFSSFLMFLGLIIGVYNKTNNVNYLILGLVIITFLALINFLIRVRQIIFFRFTGELSQNFEKRVVDNQNTSLKNMLIKIFKFFTNHLNDETGLVPIVVLCSLIGSTELVLYIYGMFTIPYFFITLIYNYFKLEFKSEIAK